MNVSEQFSLLSEELCSHLYVKEYDKGKINVLIDDLNSKPYKSELFVRKEDAAALMTSLCFNIKPVDEFLSAKTSHLLNSLVTKQNIQFNNDFLFKVIAWHIECMKKCSDIILPDILHNLQCILQINPQSGQKFINDLIGAQGLLTNLIDYDYRNMNKNSFQLCLIALKCVTCLLTIDENKLNEQENISLDIKEYLSQLMINFLMKDYSKSQDESMYCKVVISALRVISYIYFNDQKVNLPMSEVIGICRHFILHGLIIQGHPEKIMPAQQSIAAEPVKIQPKGGKKQKIRKHRNHAIECLKKEIPVSDHSLMKDVKSFDSSYKPASDYLEPSKPRASWVLTSDSDMSDIENGREAKLIALRSRVRQSAANLFLVVFKIKEKKDTFGYWWALLPDSPETNWLGEEKSKKTLAYCSVIDPVATSRASALSVILALLSGSKTYLSQAETSKKNTSFIPFSVSLGYIVTCLHKLLCSILESERSHVVIIVALKCSAALVQATPYHKMEEGLISAVVRSTRKFLVHRDVTLQVASLITIGCVLSVDPKVEEMLKAMEKDTVPYKTQHNKENVSVNDECDDFEEGYSDDEMFTALETVQSNQNDKYETYYFKSWILDICFRNMGWLCKNNDIIRCKPSTIPIILESLQVLSAISFHHFSDFLHSHTKLLGDVLSEMLQHEHQDVVLQAARTISVIGDALQRLEQQDQAPALNECVSMWEKLLPPLSSVLQNHENAPAKAVVCDCIANIGEKSFKHIPERSQRLCCALLVGSCAGEAAAVRAAAVRALAMAVMFRTLREDICFVSDCGENILRALAEPSLVVRTKAAWALGNLSDALVLNMDDPEIEDIDDDLLLRLFEVSVQCANDSDKVKMSATRSLGNLLRLIKNENLLRYPQLKALCETAIEKLLACACKVSNMKVRWNACYALGNAMKNDDLFTCLNGWQSEVFPKLCALAQHSKNFKVRTTAACALRAAGRLPRDLRRPLWRAVLAALAAADTDTHAAEYTHKDNLIEQVRLTHLPSRMIHATPCRDLRRPLWRAVLAALAAADTDTHAAEYTHKDNLIEQVRLTHLPSRMIHATPCRDLRRPLWRAVLAALAAADTDTHAAEYTHKDNLIEQVRLTHLPSRMIHATPCRDLRRPLWRAVLAALAAADTDTHAAEYTHKDNLIEQVRLTHLPSRMIHATPCRDLRRPLWRAVLAALAAADTDTHAAEYTHKDNLIEQVRLTHLPSRMIHATPCRDLRRPLWRAVLAALAAADTDTHAAEYTHKDNLIEQVRLTHLPSRMIHATPCRDLRRPLWRAVLAALAAADTDTHAAEYTHKDNLIEQVRLTHLPSRMIHATPCRDLRRPLWRAVLAALAAADTDTHAAEYTHKDNLIEQVRLTHLPSRMIHATPCRDLRRPLWRAVLAALAAADTDTHAAEYTHKDNLIEQVRLTHLPSRMIHATPCRDLRRPLWRAVLAALAAADTDTHAAEYTHKDNLIEQVRLTHLPSRMIHATPCRDLRRPLWRAVLAALAAADTDTHAAEYTHKDNLIEQVRLTHLPSRMIHATPCRDLRRPLWRAVLAALAAADTDTHAAEYTHKDNLIEQVRLTHLPSRMIHATPCRDLRRPLWRAVLAALAAADTDTHAAEYTHKDNLIEQVRLTHLPSRMIHATPCRDLRRPLWRAVLAALAAADTDTHAAEYTHKDNLIEQVRLTHLPSRMIHATPCRDLRRPLWRAVLAALAAADTDTHAAEYTHKDNLIEQVRLTHLPSRMIHATPCRDLRRPLWRAVLAALAAADTDTHAAEYTHKDNLIEQVRLTHLPSRMIHATPCRDLRRPLWRAVLAALAAADTDTHAAEYTHKDNLIEQVRLTHLPSRMIHATPCRDLRRPLWRAVLAALAAADTDTHAAEYTHKDNLIEQVRLTHLPSRMIHATPCRDLRRPLWRAVLAALAAADTDTHAAEYTHKDNLIEQVRLTHLPSRMIHATPCRDLRRPLWRAVLAALAAADTDTHAAEYTHKDNLIEQVRLTHLPSRMIHATPCRDLRRPLWRAVLAALAAADTDTHAAEYTHKDNLIEQVRLTHLPSRMIHATPCRDLRRPLWRAVLAALAAADTDTHAAEYTHKDNLIEQVRLTHLPSRMIHATPCRDLRRPLWRAVLAALAAADTDTHAAEYTHKDNLIEQVRLTHLPSRMIHATPCRDLRRPLWRAVLAALAAADTDTHAAEYTHKDNLIEQLCVTLAHLCCLLKPCDLADILEPLIFHFDCAKALFTQLHHKLPPDNPSYLKILEAAKYVTMELVPQNDSQLQTIGMLQEIFIFDV